MSELLTDLQMKITFQEHALEELNAVVVHQQNQIDVLIRELKNLKEQYESLSEGTGDPGAAVEEKPPHY